MKHLLPSLRVAAGFLLLSPWGAAAEVNPKPIVPVGTAPSTPALETVLESAGDSRAAAATHPDYVRMAGDGKSTRLEVNIVTFTLRDGRTVDLFGVVHLADPSYYEEVDRRLGTYDAVLFELIGDPAALQNPEIPPPSGTPPARPHPLRGIQQTVGNVFKLAFQLEKIDYTRPNFIHADASAGEFAKMQAERGESMMKLLLKSFELSNDPAFQAKVGDANNLGIADLVMLFYSQKTMLRIKGIFARLLAESESIMDGGLLDKNNALIDGRNEVALKKLEEVLDDPAKRRLAIFYGAGHMPSMEAALKSRLQATRTSETWLPAWTMPPASTPAAVPAPLPENNP